MLSEGVTVWQCLCLSFVFDLEEGRNIINERKNMKPESVTLFISFSSLHIIIRSIAQLLESVHHKENVPTWIY